jgi:16S rRNA (cytidine1402-2'-O)-methyltransferase
VATPIGHRGDISLRALITLSKADLVAAEDTRTTGTLLTAYGIKAKFISYHDHNEAERIPTLLKTIEEGGVVALVSEAGLPLIADPGYRLVEACREAGISVTVIPGANAALTALVGSGLTANRFHFVGFLPAKASARQDMIVGLKNIQATLLFYETAPRLLATLKDLGRVCGPTRRCVVVRELTKLHEEFHRGTLEELEMFFRKNPPKGEIVIVLSAAETEAQEMSDDELDELLKEAMLQHSVRDAVTMVCLTSNRKKSEVYARALWLSKGSPRPFGDH